MNYKITNLQIFTILFFVILSISVSGQKAPMKYGKIDKADLEMKIYPSDTSAVAAILCDYGYFNSTQIQFTRMLRIKILKKEGTHWGDKVFPTSSKSDIKGITFNLENGEIVESKLKSESIFRERVTEDYQRMRVAMPNVKEGSVIDMMFTFPGLPHEWRFQEEIPVRWSELIIEPSPYIDFRKSFFGYEPLAEKSDMRWVAKDVPAFKEEPYMNSIANYITKFEIDILNIIGYKEFTTTWDAVNSRLCQSPYFGMTLTGMTIYLNSTVKEIESKYSVPLDKLQAAFEAVKKVKWNEREALFSSTNSSLSYPFNKKIGNSAEINFILVQLLKKLDFEAYPVAMSTRANGLISNASPPSLHRLNYVIACAKVEGKTYLLDATEELIPLGLLPKRCINGKGRIIDDKKTDWVDLNTNKKDKKTIIYDLKLEPDNGLTGKIMCSRLDYAAFDFRKKYEKFNSQDEYLKDFEKHYPGLTVLNCKITNADSIYKPLQEEYEVKIKNKVNSAGNLIYINPMLYEQTTENPFKLETRQFPVDFAYPIEETYLFKLALPDGYQISEMPKSLMIKLPDNSASCIYQTGTMGNMVQVTYKLLINKPVYLINEYPDLRAFFTELIKKQAEPIVIKSN